MKPVTNQQKRLLKASSLAIAFVMFPVATLALEVKDVPNPRQIDGTWVTDKAGILSNETETQLNQMIAQLERKNGTEIAVVTVPETAPAASPKEFTTKLFNYWGIGKKGKDNGVLLLISKGDRRVEIETGYGIEAILPDAKVGNIINTQITPRFKKGDFNGGTVAGTKALVVALEAQSLALSPEATDNSNVPWVLLVGGGLAVLASGTAAYAKRRRVLSERVFMEPEGYTRLEKHVNNGNRPFHCAYCKKRLEKLEETTLQSHLSKPEQVAQKLGSLKFEAWQCRHCQEQLTGTGVHIFAYVLDKKQFSQCSTCQELTVTRTIFRKVLEEPTWNREGKQRVGQKCHCCSYYEEIEEKIPCLTPPADAVFMKPTGRSRTRESWGTTHCADCRYPMQQLDSTTLESHLNQPEQVAQRIHSIKFIGWQCPNCSGLEFHKVGYESHSGRFCTCPICEELTVIRTRKTVKSATEYSQGRKLIIDQCQCCNYHQEKEETIPRLPPPPPQKISQTTSSCWSSSSSSFSDGGGFSGGDSGGGSYSGGFSGGDSGGGSFGGGDSGGGGAGGGW